MNKKNLGNSILISLSYLISVGFTTMFIYGLLFYNRASSAQSTSGWAIIFASFLFPGALTNIFVGVLSDRSDKKKIMIRAELAAALFTILSAYLFSLGFNKMPHLCFYAAGLSVLFSFFEVTLDSSMVSIAGSSANQLVSIIWMLRAICYIIGPIAGRLLSNNMMMLFYLNAGSFLISALLQIAMRMETSSFKSIPLSELSSKIGQEIRELKEFIFKNKIIVFLLSLNLAIALFYMPVFSAIIPDLAREVGMREESLAYIESASWFGVALAAAIVAISNISGFLLRNLFNTLKIQSIMFLAWLFPLFITTSHEVAALAYIVLVALDGAVNTFQSLGALTYFQVKIPEEVRGKLLGTMRTVMKITAPLGITIYGIALEYLPWYSMMIVTSIAIFLTAVLMGRSKIFTEFKSSMESN